MNQTMHQFGAAMKDFKKQLKLDSLMVADSAFYTQENLKIVNDLQWLSRVPLKVKAAVELIKSVQSNDLMTSQMPGYRYCEIKKTYGAIDQRWLLVESEKRRESDLKSLEKKIRKELEIEEKKLRELRSQELACIADG